MALQQKGERRLAAIMFTDIVGYTSLSQANEALSLELLEEQRKTIRPFISTNRGNEIKTIGDAFLVEFASALDAVNCACDIQQSLHETNLACPLEKQINIRVGIHLGDVIHSEGDVYGDAVNVASRIVPTSEPGGICISVQVYDQVKNKIAFPIVKVGDKYLKNVQDSMEIYKITLPWENERAYRLLPRQTVMDKNRIVVLPFISMSSDPGDEYFADGLTEELITVLSGIKELDVIARTTAMQYKGASKRVSEIGRELGSGSLVEGSVRKAGDRVRISVQLVSAQNESHLWAQQYDKKLDDIFAVQTDIARRVARTLKVRLLSSERKELGKPVAENAEAYTLYLKGRYLWNKRTEETLTEAIGNFKKAIELDPSFALGYSGLADCYFVLAANEQDSRVENFEQAKIFATKALQINDKLGEAHATLAGILYQRDFDYRRSEEEFKKAIEMKPSYATAHQWYANLLQILGRNDESERELTRALELDPLSLVINSNLASQYDIKKEYYKAIELLKKIKQSAPDYPNAYAGLGRLYCLTGKYDEALREVDEFFALTKDFSLTSLFRSYCYARMGRTAEARTLLENSAPREKFSFVSGLIYFLMDDKDKGFEYLNMAADAHASEILSIRISQELNEVRSDPRYQAILRKINLE